jgi:hypothetical protein
LAKPSATVCLIALGLAAPPASAIPVFARRYQTACTTCHVLPPQLNSFGLAFRANGYRMPAGERSRQEKDVQLGAPEWEGLFPRAILPGTLPDTPPLAGFLRTSLEIDRSKPRTEATQILAVLLSAGNLGNRVSWFAAGGFGDRGAAIERLWASVDHLAGTWLNVRAGYLEPAAVPFSRYTHNLAYEGYLPFESTGPAGFALSDSRSAVEVFGAGSDPGPMRGLQYAVGLAGRKAEGGLAADGYVRASYKFGGVAAAGDTSGEPGRLVPAVAPLDERSLRIGAFAYRATLGGPDARPRGWRSGIDGDLLLGRLEAFGSAWLGGDSVSSSASEASSWSYLAGGNVRPWPWLMLMGRFESAFRSGSGPAERRIVGTVRAALQQNVAFSVDLVVEMPHADGTETAGTLFLAF